MSANMNDIDNEMMNLKNVFGTDQETLIKIVGLYQQGRSFCEEIDFLETLGEQEFIEKALKTDGKYGINDQGEEIGQREMIFGSNKKAEIESLTFVQLMLQALNDFTLKILMVAAVFSIGLSTATAEESHRSTAWIEGFSMIIAVLIVSMVTATNDLQKQKQFQDLNRVADSKKVINVIRSAKMVEIHESEILVGDVVILREGMEIPGDGLLIKNSDVSCDESAMTGETNAMKKGTVRECLLKRDSLRLVGETSGQHAVPSPVIMSGTKVLSGEGKFIVIVVGDNTCEGKIGALLRQNEVEVTPLQHKLEVIANDIGKFGMASAVLIFAVLLIRFGVERVLAKEFQMKHLLDILEFFILGIAVVVMAIPEGLPLSVTISLAFSVKRMLQDQNLVRKLQACETMGGANMICSDKTGTLTQNKMTLTKIWNDSIIDIDNYSEHINLKDYIPKSCQKIFIQATAGNSSAILRPQQQGSKTEISMLQFIERCGINYEVVREKMKEVKKIPFNSSRKRMGVLLSVSDTEWRLVEKGASEMIVDGCSHYHSFEEGVQTLDQAHKKQINSAIQNLAKQALRTIALAYTTVPAHTPLGPQDSKGVYAIEKQGLTLLLIMGIKDILRQEVPQAVMDCRRAGIKVRMVTGDNILTATAIAEECNIVQKGDQQSLVMEGVDFMKRVGGIVCKLCRTHDCCCPKDEVMARRMKMSIRKDTIYNGDEFDKIYPHLDVLARSRPEDKYALVTGLIERGHVVAVTGDGTNDAPALKKADVGFAMGIAGTEVAKQAASIILLDDNFKSIVKAVLWGRNIYDSIRKFLQFQLTVNLVGVGITLVGAITIKSEIMTPIQMLWINLIMDALASLALATESPDPSLLDRKPHRRDDYIVNKKMFKHIICQTLYQLLVLCLVTFCESIIPEMPDDLDTYIQTQRQVAIHNYQANPTDIKTKNIMLMYTQVNWGLKYGDGTPTNKGSYVRSGRRKLISDTQNIYPMLFKDSESRIPLFPGQDFEAVNSLLNLGPSRHFTFIFNTFLWMTIFNFINARKLKDEYNVFKGILSNSLFLFIVGIIIFTQVLLISFGSQVFKCYNYGPYYGLTYQQWFINIAFGVGGLIVSLFAKTINENAFQKNKSIDITQENQELEFSGAIINNQESANNNKISKISNFKQPKTSYIINKKINKLKFKE